MRVSGGDESLDVFEDDDGGAGDVDRVEEPGPTPPWILLAAVESGLADGLAGGATDHSVDGGSLGAGPPPAERSGAGMTGPLRRVPGEHGPAVRVLFGLRQAGQTGAVEPEVEPAHAGEQRTVVHAVARARRPWASRSANCCTPATVSAVRMTPRPASTARASVISANVANAYSA